MFKLHDNEQLLKLIVAPIGEFAEKVSESSTVWKGLAIVPLAVGSLVFGTIAAIAFLAESIFKGLINIVGSPFSDKCSAKKGLEQLAWGVALTPVIPFYLTYLAIKTILEGSEAPEGGGSSSSYGGSSSSSSSYRSSPSYGSSSSSSSSYRGGSGSYTGSY